MSPGIPGLLDRALDLALGGREADRHDARARRGKGPFATVEPGALFVDVVRLPATTLAEARNAIALQADRLIPFDPLDADWDVVALDDTDVGAGRKRFLLAAAPQTVLDSARQASSHARALEGFCAMVAADDGQTRAVVFRDAAAITTRRARRLRLVGAALLALGAFAFLGDAVSAWARAQGAQRASVARRFDAALAQARDREAGARTLIDSVQRASHGDALNTTVGALAVLSDPLVPGLSVEKIEIDARTVRLTGRTEDAGATERVLRARRGLAVSSFTTAPSLDPFGRGYRIDVVFTWEGAPEPS